MKGATATSTPPPVTTLGKLRSKLSCEMHSLCCSWFLGRSFVRNDGWFETINGDGWCFAVTIYDVWFPQAPNDFERTFIRRFKAYPDSVYPYENMRTCLECRRNNRLTAEGSRLCWFDFVGWVKLLGSCLRNDEFTWYSQIFSIEHLSRCVS